MTDYQQVARDFQDGMVTLNQAAPDVVRAFKELMKTTTAPGTLPFKTKELIALAIGISVRCDGCIATHAKAVVNAGATREEVVETIGVAVLMGGGPSVVYGVEALKAYDQFATAG